MKVSLNTVKQYIDIDISVDELVAKINRQLGSVEEVVNLGERYEGAVIAKVVSCKKHENADKLSVCEIDAGTGENIQVVCGAPNVREGMFVIWLKPGATVPSSFTDKEPFVLEARELRGVVSNGMIASAKELAISDSHDGILEIDPDEWKPNNIELEPGVLFADAYDLNDTIIDIENKMFTHRPDLFGQLGVAREISAILKGVTPAEEGNIDTHFQNPEWYQRLPSFEVGSGLKLEVFNDAQQAVPRLMFVTMNNVVVKPSPLWLQCALVVLGSKPINNIVDATNYTMLLTAQPTHAYDYDKIRGSRIGARYGEAGETLELLNGKTYSPTSDDIVISDGEGPIGLGGIMGGGNSEVSGETKNIILEVGTFDMYAVRKSSMRHGIFTDALTRFNKGQSPIQNSRVLQQLMSCIKGVSDAEQAGEVYDVSSKDWTHEENLSGVIEVSTSFINSRLGIDLTTDQIGNLLRQVNFVSWVHDTEGDTLVITAPFWRTDIELPEDIVEEVGRLYGYDKLPRELPLRTLEPAAPNAARKLKQAIRTNLARFGANEVLTYSFVNRKLFDKAGLDASDAYKISNALSPDLQLYRYSPLVNLLDKVHPNIKTGNEQFVLFEIGKGHRVSNVGSDGLPNESTTLDLVYAAKKPQSGAAYYHMRRYVDELMRSLNVQVRYESTSEDVRPYELTRTARIVTINGTEIGRMGELQQSVRAAFKLPSYTAAASLNFDAILAVEESAQSSYVALSRYPSLTRDITLWVSKGVAFNEVIESVNESVTSVEATRVIVEPIGVYSPEGQVEEKSITLRLRSVSMEQTLTEQDVQSIVEKLAADAGQKLGARLA